jgi:hypothetical protein
MHFILLSAPTVQIPFPFDDDYETDDGDNNENDV